MLRIVRQIVPDRRAGDREGSATGGRVGWMEPADDWSMWSGRNDVQVGQQHEPVDSGRLVWIHVHQHGNLECHCEASLSVSKNIYKAQENNLSQCAVVKQLRQTGVISVCAKTVRSLCLVRVLETVRSTL